MRKVCHARCTPGDSGVLAIRPTGDMFEPSLQGFTLFGRAEAAERQAEVRLAEPSPVDIRAIDTKRVFVSDPALVLDGFRSRLAASSPGFPCLGARASQPAKRNPAGKMPALPERHHDLQPPSKTSRVLISGIPLTPAPSRRLIRPQGALCECQHALETRLQALQQSPLPGRPDQSEG